MESLKNIINDISQLKLRTGIPELSRPLEHILKSNKKAIQIAALGQFKSGKSSLINHLISENILPVGVVPVTAIVTRLKFGSNPKLIIRYTDERSITSSIEDIASFVTEKLNPGNIKNVELATIEHPALVAFKNIHLIDTPGLSSFYRHNTEATMQWLPFTGVAMICISAERPLSEEDINLIKGTALHCPDIVIVITKIDLFTTRELNEIKAHISASIKKSLNIEIPLFEYSVKKDTQKFKEKIFEKLISPLNQNFNNKFDKLIRYKINRLIKQSIQYTELAMQAALKREQEKSSIAGVLKELSTNRHHHEREMLLSASSFKNEVRDKLSTIILRQKGIVAQRLLRQFANDYYAWKGSLFKVSRTFEAWMKEKLGNEISLLDQEYFDEINNIVMEPGSYFQYSALQFRQRLTDKLQGIFGVSLPDVSWQIDFSGIEKPNVVIYRAFDSHIDNLLFFIPMKIFDHIFYPHFKKQIPIEIEKNLYRYISILTEKIFKSIDAIHQQALLFISNENKEIENILLNDKTNYKELQESLGHLHEIKRNFNSDKTL